MERNILIMNRNLDNFEIKLINNKQSSKIEKVKQIIKTIKANQKKKTKTAKFKPNKKHYLNLQTSKHLN